MTSDCSSRVDQAFLQLWYFWYFLLHLPTKVWFSQKYDNLQHDPLTTQIAQKFSIVDCIVTDDKKCAYIASSTINPSISFIKIKLHETLPYKIMSIICMCRRAGQAYSGNVIVLRH